MYEQYQDKQNKLEQMQKDINKSIVSHVMRMRDNIKQEFAHLHNNIYEKLLSMPPTDKDILEGRRNIDTLLQDRLNPSFKHLCMELEMEEECINDSISDLCK